MNADASNGDLPAALQVGLQPYHPAWPRMFELERDRLWRSLAPVGGVVAIEHVGATAVAGLTARPHIDLLIGVTDLKFGLERWSDPLKKAGYLPVTGLNEVVPEVHFLMRPATDPAGAFVLLVTTAGSQSWDDILLFRDQLRSAGDPLIRSYTQLRAKALEDCGNDPKSYLQAKRSFVCDEARRAAQHRREAESGQRFQIRRLNADDHEIAVSLVRRFKRPQSVGAVDQYVRRVLNDPRVILIAAVAAGPDLTALAGPRAGQAASPDDDVRHGPNPTPIGFALAYELPRLDADASMIFFHDIEVDPVFRGRGVGRRLTDHMIQICDRVGCSLMFALTSASNRVATRLHESKGARQPNRNEDILFVYEFDH